MGRPVRIREFARALTGITSPTMPERTRLGNDQARPFGIISIDHGGNISTFSPELLGAQGARHSSFIFGNVLEGELVDILDNRAFREIAQEVAEGVGMCARQCAYFNYCGGGAPVNKLYENGSFASTETMFCRNSIQIPIQILLNDLEAQLGIGSKNLRKHS